MSKSKHAKPNKAQKNPVLPVEDSNETDIYSYSGEPSDVVETRYERVKCHGKKKGLLITAISFLSVFSILFIGAGSYGLAAFMSIYNENLGDVITSEISLASDEIGGTDTVDDYNIWDGATKVTEIPVRENTENITNIMIVGVDSRSKKSYAGRSDTMMIMTINKKTKTIKLTSFLRDTYAALAGTDFNRDGQDDYQKLAHAYAYGKYDKLAKTIEQNFRLKIEKHVAVNFRIFESCIDTLGGIDIKLTAKEAKWIKVGNTEGTYSLKGKKALAYVRIRKLDSDYARTERQRKMIAAILQKAKKMNVVQLVSIFDSVFPNISTSMTSDELMSFILSAGTYLSYDIVNNEHFPAKGEFTAKTLPSAGFVQVINDPADAVTKLHHMIYD